MPTSPTAGAPWILVSTPVYVNFWFLALPTVTPPGPPPGPPPPGPPTPPPVVVPPTSQPPASPGSPSSTPAPVLLGVQGGVLVGGPLQQGVPIFVQTNQHPVFLHPKPTYRPIENVWDACLRDEWALWKLVKPFLDCQAIWSQGCFPEDWADAPPDMVTFNPVESIPLPAAAAGDLAVIRMEVPTGYDGLILAHFHSVSFPGGAAFAEGSGDLVWRLSADGRFVRNMGRMLTQEGSPKWLSPIAGGQFVRTGNIVQYTVAAPNLTGTLPAGGVALAGLHGWFWPRG